jgi:type IV secretion system protein VirD4
VHEDIAAPTVPLVNEFDFESGKEDEEASQNRRIADRMRATARQAALDPGDGIDL